LRACPSAFRCLDYEHDPIEAAERIIAAMPNAPQIEHAGSKAFYSPITDRITLPPRELFRALKITTLRLYMRTSIMPTLGLCLVSQGDEVALT